MVTVECTSCHVLLFFLQLSDANLFILWRCFLIVPCHYLECDGLRPKPAPILRDHPRLRSLASPFTPTNTPRAFNCAVSHRLSACNADMCAHVCRCMQTHTHMVNKWTCMRRMCTWTWAVWDCSVCVRARDVTSVAVSHETSDHENQLLPNKHTHMHSSSKEQKVSVTDWIFCGQTFLVTSKLTQAEVGVNKIFCLERN